MSEWSKVISAAEFRAALDAVETVEYMGGQRSTDGVLWYCNFSQRYTAFALRDEVSGLWEIEIHDNDVGLFDSGRVVVGDAMQELQEAIVWVKAEGLKRQLITFKGVV